MDQVSQDGPSKDCSIQVVNGNDCDTRSSSSKATNNDTDISSDDGAAPVDMSDARGIPPEEADAIIFWPGKAKVS